MEIDCNSDYDGSANTSMKDEEEDEEEPQEGGQLSSRCLKHLNQNEEVKSKLSNAMGIISSEDNGLTWETSSSRCSTSQASETSATSGVYSMENSYMDSPSGNSIPLIDEGKIVQKRTSNSPDQVPLSPNQKINPDSSKHDHFGGQMQVNTQERELDLANPQSWPYQVQPSKIKDYLVQITQEVVTSLSEEKENNLKRKGELPLKGTVRARIQQITAVLEERNKKIFQRVNRTSLPAPPEVIKKPREQAKVFSRQGISVSLRHIERDAADKNDKKEMFRYNLKHVQTNISKTGVSVPYSNDEKRVRRSFLPETRNKEKQPSISPPLAGKANKLDAEPYSPVTQMSGSEQESFALPDHCAKPERKHPPLPDTVNAMSEKSSNLLAETENQKLQHYLPMTTGIADILESMSMPETKPVQSSSPVSAEPLSFSANKVENQSESTVTLLSEATTQDVQCPDNTVEMQHEPKHAETRNQSIESHPSQSEISCAALLHSAEETSKQDIPLYSPTTEETVPEQTDLRHSVSDIEQQEMRQVKMEYSKEEEIPEQPTTTLQTESEYQSQVHSVKESEAREMETVPNLPSTTSRLEAQESQGYPYTTAEEHSELPQPSYLMDETEKEGTNQSQSNVAMGAVQAQRPMTPPLESENLEKSHLRDETENQTAQEECQYPESSFSIPDAERKEIPQCSTATAQSESDPPVASEPIKAPQRSKHLKPSHLQDEEASLFSPAEVLNSPEHLPSISSFLTENVEKQEMRQVEVEYAKKEETLEQPTTTLQTESEYQHWVHSVKESEAQEMETVPNLSSTTSRLEAQESQSYPYKTAEEHSGLPQPSYLMDETEEEGTKQLQSNVAMGAVQAQRPMTPSLESENLEKSHLRDVTENQTAQEEYQYPDSSFSIPDAEREEIPQRSTATAQSESEPPVATELIKAPQRSKHLKPSLLQDEEASLFSPAETLNSPEHLPSISSLLTENVEKQETQPCSLVTAMPPSKQPDSILSYPTKQMEKEDNLPCSPETAVSESSLSTVAFQSADIAKVEIKSYSHTKTLSEELESISRESDVAVERETTQPDSLLAAEEDSHKNKENGSKECVGETSALENIENENEISACPENNEDVILNAVGMDSLGKYTLIDDRSFTQTEKDQSVQGIQRPFDVTKAAEPPREVSVQSQEATKLENQVYLPVNSKLYPEDQQIYHPTADEVQQEGQFHSLAMTPFEAECSVVSEARKQSIEQNSSVSPQREEAINSVDEVDKKDAYPSKSITEPSLYPVCVPEEQERVQSEIIQMTQQLSSSTVLQTESDMLHSVEETEIDGTHAFLPATAKNLPEPVCVRKTQGDQDFSTRTASLDSGSLNMPHATTEAEMFEAPELELKHMTKQTAIQAVTTELEPDYAQVLPALSESGKRLDESFSVPSIELQSHRSVTLQSVTETEHPVSSENEREETVPYSSIIPISGQECPAASPETQEIQGYSSNTPNETSKPPPIFSSVLPDKTNELAVPAESIKGSMPPSEQRNMLLPELKDKPEMEESPFSFPEMPKMVPEESLSIIAFLIDEARKQPSYSAMETQMLPKESQSIPEGMASEAVKEMALPASPVSAEDLSKGMTALYAVYEGEKQDHSHSLLAAQSKHQAVGKTDMQKATEQSETTNQYTEAYCPVTSQSEGLTRLRFTEEIMKQEPSLYSSPIVQLEPIPQGPLHHIGERDNQKQIPLEAELSKVQNAPLKSSILQEALEHLNVSQSVAESKMEGTEPHSSATSQDSSQLASETGTQKGQGYLPKTADVDSGVSVLLEFMDEAKKQEIQPPWPEAVQLECKEPVSSAEVRGKVQHYPPVTTPLDQGHLDATNFTETQFGSSDAPNQTSKQSTSVSALLLEKIEEQKINSYSPAVSRSSALGQSNSILPDLTEKAEKQKIQPYSPETENVVPEESLSIAAFLLSEAKEIQTPFSLAKEKESLDIQLLQKEVELLTERNGSSGPFESNITIGMEIQPSLTHFESEPFSSKPQAEVTDQDTRENLPDSPTIPNVILNEPSNTVMLEHMNDSDRTHECNLHSSVCSANSDTSSNKAIVISVEDISKTEEVMCLPSVEQTLKEYENDLQQEKELKCEQLTEEAVSTPEVGRGKDTFGISEGHKVVSIHAPPFTSSADKEENDHMPERLEYVKTVAPVKIKQLHDVEDMVVKHEPSACKQSTTIPEGLKEDNHENKENRSQEFVGGTSVVENVGNEIIVCLENNDDGILSTFGIDSLETYTLIDNRSSTQPEKGQSVQGIQMPFDISKENSEEATSPPISPKHILEFSFLERDLDEAFQGMVKKENTTAEQEYTSKMSNKGELIDSVRKTNKHTEDELTVVGAPLFNSENDTLSQTPIIPLPVTAVNPEVLEKLPVLAFLYENLNEESMKELKKDTCKHPSSEETETINVPFHGTHEILDGGTGTTFKKDFVIDDTSNKLEESQKEKVVKDLPINEQVLNQPRISQGIYEPNEKELETVHLLTEAYAQTQVLPARGLDTRPTDALRKEPEEIMSDVKVQTCQPTHAVPFGSRLYSSGATTDEGSQTRAEESLPVEIGQMLPEETSDEESSPILNYAATVYQEETLVQDESKDAACLAVDQNQPSGETEVNEIDNNAVRKPVEESRQFNETFHHLSTEWQSGGQPGAQLVSVLQPTAQDTHALDHEPLPCWGTEGQTSEKRVGENTFDDLTKCNRDVPNQQFAVAEAKSDQLASFGELDYSLLSHDFDTYPLYSIKEEEYSDADEDLAEFMEYEMVTRDDVFQEETSSEVAREEMLLDERKSLDRVSDMYEFVNEGEVDAEDEEFELMGLEKLPKSVLESEILQQEIEQAQLDAYCYQCKCLLPAEDKLFGNHKEHKVTELDSAATELKGQLDGFLDVLQNRSMKIEQFVSAIETLFNSLEENCKEKEQLLEEQNESIIKTVIGHHDKKAQSFEEVKNTKMEYLYEQMVSFQEYIDTAKDTLETIIKETEEMDDFVFLRSTEEINKRLLAAVENILMLEKMPAAFSQFECYASNSANGNQTFKLMPVPQTPKLQPQDPNSATGTSIAVYWTVNEDDVIDFFQVYCMEEHPETKEHSGLVEEYRVTVKESNCILEDLEPGHSYSVWVMAVNYTGCSFPSNKSTFRTAPPTPVILAEDCTVCWNIATIRWNTGNSEATDSFTLEYCRQYSPEGEGLRSLAGIKRPELKVNLEPNVNYFFYVRAVNIFGTSEQSEAALISTKGSRFHIMKETAHPALQVSPNGTMIRLPEETTLTGISPVLGEVLTAQGWHYWETTVTDCRAYKVGICYSTLPGDSVLGQNNTSWCLHCSSKTSFIYKVLHNGEMGDVIVTELLARIGILLDYDTGRLLFFNAERGQELFVIKQKFTNAAHPAFVLEQPGTLTLHTGMELPEFAKYS